MTTQEQTARIVISVNVPDLGEATRALEIARGITRYQPPGWRADITFLSHGGTLAGMTDGDGFSLAECEPTFAGISFREDLRTQYPNLVGTPELARDLIVGERAALARLRPDLVLHGFWPPASIASRMLGIPTGCFNALPLHPDTLLSKHFVSDIPDPITPLTYLPRPIRKTLARHLPLRARLNAPIFPQRNFRLGAEAAGWQGKPLERIWDMLQAELTIVNDLPDFYTEVAVPESFQLTGPLFASSGKDQQLAAEVARRFDPGDPRPKIFCAMGSSPEKPQLLEAITALAHGAARAWSSVVVVPPGVCSLAEARARAGDAENVYLTSEFVPALRVNSLADAVVSHGGQGTVQTAIVSGTPIVGFGVQMEQQINLDHVADAGAGIRIPINRWHAGVIRRAVTKVLTNPGYRQAADRLRQRYLAYDGQRNAALAIWERITRTKP